MRRTNYHTFAFLEVNKLCKELGIPVDSQIDMDMAKLICEDLGYEVKVLEEENMDVNVNDGSDDNLMRPLVISIMGHVDHGMYRILRDIYYEKSL